MDMHLSGCDHPEGQSPMEAVGAAAEQPPQPQGAHGRCHAAAHAPVPHPAKPGASSWDWMTEHVHTLSAQVSAAIACAAAHEHDSGIFNQT